MDNYSMDWFSVYRNRWLLEDQSVIYGYAADNSHLPKKDRLDLYAYILGYKPLFDNNGQSIERQEIEEFTPPTEKDLLDLYGMKG